MPMTANGLAKLLEELGELSQVAAKRLAYFHTSTHPDGAGDLNDRMEQEMGDVQGAIAFVIQQFGLSERAVSIRSTKKLTLFNQWHADPSNGRDCFHARQPGSLDTEAAMLERIAAAVPSPHDTSLCSVARKLRAHGVVVDHGLHSKPVVDHEAANLRDNTAGVGATPAPGLSKRTEDAVTALATHYDELPHAAQRDAVKRLFQMVREDLVADGVRVGVSPSDNSTDTGETV